MWVLQIIIAICLLFQMERAIFDTSSFFRLSRRLKKIHSEGVSQLRNPSRKRLFILIPVFSEQKIIEKTLLHFLHAEQPFFDIQVVVITTIRERSEFGLTNTEDIIKQSLTSGMLSSFKSRILVIQDPDPFGNMATQLNYALKVLSQGNMHSDDLYILYNADSAISQKTYSALSNLIKKYSHINNYAFQQPCAYVRDMKASAPNFLNALSLYQTWYCLAHESRLIQKYEANMQEKKSSALGVTVGHGSGMPVRVHFENGGYPADLMTEDLTFGFILSANNVPIFLLPALEIADVPGKFSAFVKQKSVWFWNYIGYLACYQRMKRKRKGLWRLTVLLLRGVGGGAYWFFSALFLTLPVVLSFFLKDSSIIASVIIATLLFAFLPHYILLRKLPDILQKQGFNGFAANVQGVSFAQVFFSLCLILVTDSLGPWIAIMRSFHYLLTGKLPKKYKTES